MRKIRPRAPSTLFEIQSDRNVYTQRECFFNSIFYSGQSTCHLDIRATSCKCNCRTCLAMSVFGFVRAHKHSRGDDVWGYSRRASNVSMGLPYVDICLQYDYASGYFMRSHHSRLHHRLYSSKADHASTWSDNQCHSHETRSFWTITVKRYGVVHMGRAEILSTIGLTVGHFCSIN